MPHLFVFGLGYSARRIAEELVGRGWRVSGTSRSEEGAERLAAAGFGAHRFDGEHLSPTAGAALTSATHLLISVPPGGDGDPVLRHHRRDVLGARGLEWIGYLSTTGVYGDRGGAWVDESTRPRPGTSRSRRRLEAERGWRVLAEEAEICLQVFRLSGIYGPGRSVLDRLRSGTARRIVAPDLVFNRIHVDDIAGAVCAGTTHPEVDGVINVSDDEPASPAEVVAYAAGLLGMEAPPEVSLQDADLSAAARSFYEENKRVRSTRLEPALGYRLRHPTYREGLEAILDSED